MSYWQRKQQYPA